MSDHERERRRRRKKIATWVKRGVLGAVAAAAVGAAVLAFLPEPIPVDVARAERGELRVTVREDGQTRVVNRYTVSAPIGGTMPRIDLREGDHVTAGQVLLGIAPTPPPLLDERTRADARAQVAAARAGARQAAAQVARAEAAVEEAASLARRQENLWSDNATSKQELELAQYALRARREELAAARFGARVAEEQVVAARAALGYIGGGGGESEELSVPSPTDGVVLRVLHRDAGPVQMGAALLELGDPQSLEIVADVLTRDAVHITEGAEVAIDRWGGDAALAGRVRRVEPSAFTRVSALGVEEQRVNVVIDFDAPPAERPPLGDGYRVEVDIVVWQGDDVLSVPSSAVFRRGDSWAVFAVDGDTAVLRDVTIGRRTARRTEITEGLTDGDEVVLHPSDRIANGVEITKRED